MENKYLKYKNKYLNLRNKIRNLIGGNINLRCDNYCKITSLLKTIDSSSCINSFIKEENIPKELFCIEKVIGSGVNGEVLSIKLNGHPENIAVKTIPITKTDNDSIRSYDGHSLNVVSALAEIKALEICTQYILTKKSPHFNMMYKHLLCNNCQYIGEKVQEQRFTDIIEKSYTDKLNDIKKANALVEGNSPNRINRIKDVQQFNKTSGNIISQYCLYIFNENAHGDMLSLITPDLTFNNLKIYLFQIFSALNLCYIEHEMSHHDFHCKNILFVNDEYNDVDHDLYNIIIEKDDKTEREIISVKLPLNGIMLRIWDFGRVNIQGKMHILKTTYFLDEKKSRFHGDVRKLFNDGDHGLKNNVNISDNKEFIDFIIELECKYAENGYFGLMKYLIKIISEINTSCVTERYKYNF
jgi:hypothetical protein